MAAAAREIKVSDYLAEGNILCRMGNIPAHEAVDRLVSLLFMHVGGFDRQGAIDSVMEREQLDSTVLIEGLALPHARMDGLQQPMVAVGLSHEGVYFPENNELVRILILVLTPKSDPSAYLKLVSAISKSLSEESLRLRLGLCDTPSEAYALLTAGVRGIPAHLVARDLMNAQPVTVREEDDLATAISAFCVQRQMDIPVVDETGDIRGVLAIEDLLHLSLPEHFLWMEDLTPIVNFQPFAELLRKDHETKVADFMRDRFTTMDPETPAIQLAKDFLKSGVRQIMLAENDKLIGVVNVQNFVAQLFWA
ncbi:MAG: PTS sugar transporter subunit IIA [Kiritimatiellae bacterium]|nr:PTS sugar transporter subunit IIA [Kiritimatiellia bacterium]